VAPGTRHQKSKKARWFPSGPLREHDFVVDRLRAESCQAVQGTVMVVMMRVVDERHDP
jgi:hypothetical protein